MRKYFFPLAFLTGAIAVIWVGFGFIDSSPLAMAMTALIFAVYLAGASELHRFRQATATLTSALKAIATDAPDLNQFLSGLAGSLQHPVRLRIEGTRSALPGPSMTPYLVGLLVMLGMLGTFLGMVVTLKGAVFTLEKTADLAAMRSALAVPVKGLGLAFGTSVAGVAASAVLGLMSALCRHERMLAGQLLDSKAATVLSGFSHARQQEQTFRALQSQSEALPQVVDKLQAMMLQIEAMNDRLNQSLLTNQEQFHNNATATYTELARSVDKSLRESLTNSAQTAGEGIRPIFEAAMQGIAQEARAMHERTAGTVQQQLDGLAARFGVATEGVAQTWNAALENQAQTNRSMASEMARALTAFSAAFDTRAGALVATVGATYANLQAGQAAHDAQRQQAWTQSLEAMAATLTSELRDSGAQVLAQQQEICTAVTRAVREAGDVYVGLQTGQAAQDAQRQQAWTQSLEAMAATLSQELQESGAQVLAQQREICTAVTHAVQETGQAYANLQTGQAAQDAQRLQAWTQSLEAMAATLTRELQESGAQVLTQQRDVCAAVTHAVGTLAEQVQADAGKSLAQARHLVTTAEELMRSRIAAEAQWLDQHSARMNQLAGLLQTELGALRDQEAARGDAAVAHLGHLQSVVSTHLTTLGTALEEPISRLIETAAEAPRAAAEVIGQLRQEISNSVARDNVVLEERSRIMETLNSLLGVINHASHEQRAVIDALVASSSDKLDAASTAFSANVAGESAKLAEIAANVTTSAVDVASLADAFGVAVRAFNEANEKLASNLDRIETALDKSMSRSDGQLAYYVAQAREIIDLSMSSQKEIVDELRQLPAMLAVEGK
ncbi:DUF802 domain-containing protein [Massilia sp. CF038]|uniref:DUF802 domain-containing protein n=1 Tax=Massilia sp. CF038 TaxID=1881045 RepID=UPI00091213CF|nr:DUF802 domain-containing protein [Massilia sp. CF038]SHH20324.1 protein of unknown function [Massilia sp. CF038]